MLTMPREGVNQVQGSTFCLTFSHFEVTHSGLHKLCHPTIRDGSTRTKFGACGEHGDVFLFSNLGAL